MTRAQPEAGRWIALSPGTFFLMTLNTLPSLGMPPRFQWSIWPGQKSSTMAFFRCVMAVTSSTGTFISIW